MRGLRLYRVGVEGAVLLAEELDLGYLPVSTVNDADSLFSLCKVAVISVVRAVPLLQ